MSNTNSLLILIVVGNRQLANLLAWQFQECDYQPKIAHSLAAVRPFFVHRVPDLVVIDGELPDGEAIDFLRALPTPPPMPVLVISAKERDVDAIATLSAGAADYVRKPFSVRELQARVNVLLRGKQQPVLPTYGDYGTLRVDLVRRRAIVNGENIDLTPQEFSLLYVLLQAAGRTLSREELLQRAWDENVDNLRTIDTHILSLRKKLDLPDLIQTVRGLGYLLRY